MGSAIGGFGKVTGSGGSDSSPPNLGTLDEWVTDYGAVADGSTDCSAAFQAAVDALIAAGVGNGSSSVGVIHVPSALKPYILAKSVWVDSDAIWIVGEGLGSHIQMGSGCCVPAFIFGVPRDQGYTADSTYVHQTITSAYRPDCSGILDSSVVSGINQKWGVRTNAVSVVQYQGGPLSSGVSSALSSYCSDNWSETSKLTIDVCFEPPADTTFPLGAPLFGLGYMPDDPAPFTVSIRDTATRYIVCFKTSDIDPNDRVYRWFGFDLEGLSLPYRLAIQIDLDAAVCTAFCNGTQLAFTDDYNISSGSPIPFVASSGMKFATNDHYPFMIGYSDIRPPYGGSAPADICVYGLRLSNAIRYQNNGSGQPQKRADSPSTTIVDSYSYFGNDANTICYMTCLNDPSTSGREVTFETGGAGAFAGHTNGFFQHVNSTYTSPINNGISSLNISGANSYGQVIMIGAIFDFSISDTTVYGGFHAIGNFNFGANYDIHIKNCKLRGFDAGIYTDSALIYGETIEFTSTGRVPIRLYASSASIHDIFAAFADPVCESLVKSRAGQYGGSFVFEDVEVDFEGNEFTLAAFYVETCYSTPVTTLTLRNVELGTIGANVPILRLADTSAPDNIAARSYVRIENMKAFTTSYESIILLDGPKWYGELVGNMMTGTRLKHLGTYGTNCNVVIRECQFTAPPRSLYWYKGAHILDVPNVSDGQYGQWRCVGTGEYGTSTPPVWAGYGQVASSPSSLAGYVNNHCYIAPATLSEG